MCLVRAVGLNGELDEVIDGGAARLREEALAAALPQHAARVDHAVRLGKGGHRWVRVELLLEENEDGEEDRAEGDHVLNVHRTRGRDGDGERERERERARAGARECEAPTVDQAKLG